MARTARYTASVSAMVEEDTKAFLLGCAEVEQASEGDVIRSLFDQAIEHVKTMLTREEVEKRMTAGHAELTRRRQ